eukprot:jgi/Chlat1/7325/Chrsp58S06925
MWNYRWSIPQHETATAAIATTCSKMLRLLSTQGIPSCKRLCVRIFRQLQPQNNATCTQVHHAAPCMFFHASLHLIYDAVSGKLIRRLGGHGATVRDASRHPYLPIMVTSSVNECLFAHVHVVGWLSTVADWIVALLFQWDRTLGVWEHVR